MPSSKERDALPVLMETSSFFSASKAPFILSVVLLLISCMLHLVSYHRHSLRFKLDYRRSFGSPETIVPILLPLIRFFILSAFLISKTIIGRLLSMHIEIAVESITFRLYFRTSIYDILSYFLAAGSFIGSAV